MEVDTEMAKVKKLLMHKSWRTDVPDLVFPDKSYRCRVGDVIDAKMPDGSHIKAVADLPREGEVRCLKCVFARDQGNYPLNRAHYDTCRMGLRAICFNLKPYVVFRSIADIMEEV